MSFRSFIVSVCFVVILCSVSLAFPPAPGAVVYGMVRDESGQPVEGPAAFIILKSGDTEIIRKSIVSGISDLENYRAFLPLDMDVSTGGYKDDLLQVALPFTVEVEIGGEIFNPIETLVGFSAPVGPASLIRIDFSLGSDSDMDSLPDEWELNQLRLMGISEDSSEFNLDQLTGLGDYDGDGLSDRSEYLLGSFAYVGRDWIQLKILNALPDGSLEFRFLPVAGMTFYFEASSDLENWSPIEVIIDEDHANPSSSLAATNTDYLNFSISKDESDTNSYYRIRFQ